MWKKTISAQKSDMKLAKPDCFMSKVRVILFCFSSPPNSKSEMLSNKSEMLTDWRLLFDKYRRRGCLKKRNRMETAGNHEFSVTRKNMDEVLLNWKISQAVRINNQLGFLMLYLRRVLNSTHWPSAKKLGSWRLHSIIFMAGSKRIWLKQNGCANLLWDFSLKLDFYTWNPARVINSAWLLFADLRFIKLCLSACFILMLSEV